MEDLQQNICKSIPRNLTNCVTYYKNNEQYLLNYLQNLLPSSDSKSLMNELRKTFIFSKLKARRTQRVKTKKGKCFSTRKRMLLGLAKVGYNNIKYTDILPLHHLWMKYMRHMFGNKYFSKLTQEQSDTHWESINQQLMKADYHGARISVLQSKCPSLVDIEGIVIQDTKNTFRICGPDNTIRTIPKNVVVLRLHLDEKILQLFGKQLCVRPTERTVKKFKSAHYFQL